VRRATELALGPVLLCIVASALGSLALFAIAVGLALVYLGLFWAVNRAATRLVVLRTVRQHEVVEGTPIEFSFQTQGLERLPVELEVLCNCGEWHQIEMGASTSKWPIDRPGRHVIHGSPMRLRDDLGLFTRVLFAGDPEEVLVLPAPASTPVLERRGALDLALDPEPDGLKTYVRGTPMSRIHWASAARGGELQERNFTSSRDHLPLVVVDTAGNPPAEAVDWAARQAAGHVLAFARTGGCRVLLPGDSKPITLMDPAAHWPAIHRRLASLGRGTPVQGKTRIDLSQSVHVSALSAPPHAVVKRGALPPGVVGVGEWAGE
jgi:uncharacterized protein (DUF58 family)